MVRAAVPTETRDDPPVADESPPAEPTTTPVEDPPRDVAPRPEGLRAWWFMVFPLVAVVELVSQFVIQARVPKPEHWRAAHDHIARARREGDLVTSAPVWTDPLARMHFRDLIALRDAARPDASRYPRAWVATIRGAEHPDFQGWRETSSQSFGPVTVRLLTNPAPATVRFDFADNLRPPNVTVERVEGESRRGCAFAGGLPVTGGGLGQGALPGPERFQCGEPWNYVGVTVIEDMQHRGRRCIWSHPVQGGVMVTRFDAVPMGAVIHGHHGIAYEAERGDDFGNDLGGPVELRVLIDDRSVGASVHRDGEGWKGFEFNTAAYAGSTHRVTFEVRSERAGMRHYCFEGDTR